MADGVLLAGRGLTKAFGHVEALRGVDIDVREGSVTGVVGDNGAGKSTLIGNLSGVLQPDAAENMQDAEVSTYVNTFDCAVPAA